ncbi:2-dehydropantoate 2-reductase [Leucobacter allii]|uniref:2-dehydropantoate 2-reductase n=1 Tax=Leucobacter allii TaxID=2932247 RepID=A0ABY4FKR8_9MICO|nr:2-dehydropantoate 2-reductase [Leucobacter allii]UOQ56866.1 2-dehydropantoate 2-reductase [Leucobacter allii]
MGDARIAVLGAGANGASIGADLFEAGHDVTLIEQWPAHVERMRTVGLTIVTEGEERTVRPRAIHLCEVAEERAPFDVVLMLMKAYDARWAAQLIAPLLAESGVMAGVQNGMTTPAVRDAVGAERTVGTVIECSATMFEPGLVHRHTGRESAWFATGLVEGGDPARESVVTELLSAAGRVEHFEDIESAKWMKLVSNATLLVSSAILNLPMLDAMHLTGYRELMIELGDEALRVGAALGHATLPIFGLSEQQVRDPSRVVANMTDQLFAGFVRPGATTTVLQDWQRGRRSEAEDLNGHVVLMADRVGIEVPANRRVLELARRIERGEVRPDPALLGEMRVG